MLRDRSRNFLFNYLGLGEDQMGTIVRPDCADLPYFLRELVGAEYAHEPLLTPTEEILKAYKRQGAMPWAE